jgi:hypothetical protein
MWTIICADGYHRYFEVLTEACAYVRGYRISRVVRVDRPDGSDGWQDIFGS